MSKVPATRVWGSSYAVDTSRHLQVASQDESDCEGKRKPVMTLTVAAAAKLLSPQAEAQSDKIGTCKFCGDKPHLFIIKRNNGEKELWPSDRMSTCNLYYMSEEKERLEVLIK